LVAPLFQAAENRRSARLYAGTITELIVNYNYVPNNKRGNVYEKINESEDVSGVIVCVYVDIFAISRKSAKPNCCDYQSY